MALWKDQSSARKDASVPEVPDAVPRTEVAAALQDYAPPAEAARNGRRADSAESVIGADLAIEGTISGNGNVRLAGRFTGDVTVDGTVTIESGAKLAGGVRATTVAIAGELEGNVVEAKRVDVHASGVLMGDLKADTLTLAAGSRVRGHIDCGWAETPVRARGGSARGVAPTSSPAHSSNGTEPIGLA
jgi:cytoskeletal protein CcmA (bactofilin family)